LLVVCLVGLAGCGGGSELSKEEAAERIDQVCVERSAYSAWLPAHAADEDLSAAEAARELEKRIDDIDDTDDLDAPDEVTSALDKIEKLTDRPNGSGDSAEAKSVFEQVADLYDEIGADKCRDIMRANVLTLDGSKSLEDAYAEYDLTFPERPDDW